MSSLEPRASHGAATDAASPPDVADVRVYWPYFIGTENPISYLFSEIAPHFDGSEFDVTVLSVADEPLTHTSNVTERPSTDFDTWRGRAAALRGGLDDIDLIHTGGNPLLHYPVARLARLRNPDLTHVHTFRVDVDLDYDLYRKEDALRRKLGRMADVTTAVSHHTAGTVEAAFGFSPRVIYNGVNTDWFHPDQESPPLFEEYGADGPVFVFVGTFDERKNPLDVVAVAEQVPEATFLLVGGGGAADGGRAVDAALDRVDNAHYVGRVEKSWHLPRVYAHATGFLFPSVMEGCPNVVLESMACGTPVVGYEATSMPEVVAHGETGYLVETGDVEALTDAASRLIEAPTDRLRRNAREYVLENHGFADIAGQYMDVYRDALDAER